MQNDREETKEPVPYDFQTKWRRSKEEQPLPRRVLLMSSLLPPSDEMQTSTHCDEIDRNDNEWFEYRWVLCVMCVSYWCFGHHL